LGSELVFSEGGVKLVKTNGSAAPLILSSVSSISKLCSWNGRVFFAGATYNQGVELYVTDGTVAGTQLFKDICPGATGSNPKDFIVIGNKLYFTAVSVAGGKRELWVSSGLSFNTMKVKEVGEVRGKMEPLTANSMAFPQKFYFVVAGANGNDNVWESNGTPEGTKKLSLPVLTSGIIQLLPIMDGWVRFFAKDIAGNGQLYKVTFYVNSAMAPTAAIEYSMPAGTVGRSVGLCNGKLFYTTGGSGNTKLWTMVGGAPVQVRPTSNQISWEVEGNSYVHRNWLYFTADAGGGGYELYKVQ